MKIVVQWLFPIGAFLALALYGHLQSIRWFQVSAPSNSHSTSVVAVQNQSVLPSGEFVARFGVSAPPGTFIKVGGIKGKAPVICQMEFPPGVRVPKSLPSEPSVTVWCKPQATSVNVSCIEETFSIVITLKDGLRSGEQFTASFDGLVKNKFELEPVNNHSITRAGWEISERTAKRTSLDAILVLAALFVLVVATWILACMAFKQKERVDTLESENANLVRDNANLTKDLNIKSQSLAAPHEYPKVVSKNEDDVTKILAVVREDGPLTRSEIATHAKLDPRVVNRWVPLLQSNAALKRERKKKRCTVNNGQQSHAYTIGPNVESLEDVIKAL